MIPTLGRIVHYTLSSQDAEAINGRRRFAIALLADPGNAQSGCQLHDGNQASEGQTFPMLITRVWGNVEGSAVNGQVHLDGNDLHWVTSTVQGEGPRTWREPPRV